MIINCFHFLFLVELPKPQLGDLSDLKALSIKMRRQRAPNILGFTYSELKSLDTIKVELVPEKKGLILKHVEYEVSSKVRNYLWMMFIHFKNVCITSFSLDSVDQNLDE